MPTVWYYVAMKLLADHFNFRDVIIRPTTNEDIELLVELINPAYSYQEKAKGEPRTNPDHLRRRIAETEFYSVVSNGKIIGCVYVEQKGESLHFGLLTLMPEWRGRGLAQAIMEAIERHAQDRGLSVLELDYMSLAPWLKGYYEKYGFQKTGQTTRWGTIDLVRMKKKIT